MGCATRSTRTIPAIRGAKLTTEAPHKDLRWVIIAAAVIFVAVAIAIVFVRDAQAPPTPVALPLTKTFDDSPTGFTLKYPEEWQYIIPAVGVMVMGPPQTLSQNEPGPSLTIQRSYPLSISGSLEGALDSYLQAGPLNGDGLWQITVPPYETVLDNREARTVELEGSNAPGIALLHTSITVAAADNTFIYLVVASSPAERVANFAPTLDAILQTFEILE